MTSAVYSGLEDMEFVLGDDVSFTVTVSVTGVTDLTGWTIRLSFTHQRDGTTFDKTEADTDWIDNTAAASLQFDVIVDSTPTTVSSSGGSYIVKCAIESGSTRHIIGNAKGALWTFVLPGGGAYADL